MTPEYTTTWVVVEPSYGSTLPDETIPPPPAPPTIPAPPPSFDSFDLEHDPDADRDVEPPLF